jgi:hypothetical protein
VSGSSTIEAEVCLTSTLFLLLGEGFEPGGIHLHCIPRRGGRVYRGRRCGSQGRSCSAQASLLASFKKAIVTADSLGNGFAKGRGVRECQQEILDIITEAKLELIDQGGLPPIDIAGKLAEFGSIGGHGSGSLLKGTEFSSRGSGLIGVPKGCLELGQEGSKVSQKG